MINLEQILSNIDDVYNIIECSNEELKNEFPFLTLLECSTKCREEEFNIIVGIKKDFPISAPEIFWKDFKNSFLPHIEEENGKICYLEEDNYTFDMENIEGIMHSCIKIATEIIYKGTHRLNFDDFVNEFESYWIRNDLKIISDSYIKLDDKIRIIKFYSVEKNFIWYEKEDDLNFALKQCKQLYKKENIQDAIYIPLENNINIYPPRKDECWTIGQVRNIIKRNLSHKKYQYLSNILKNNKYIKAILMTFPDKKKGKKVIGIECYNVKRLINKKYFNPIITGFINCKMLLFYINRKDRDYLVNRGGAIDSILNKKVLILGCGSLGGHITEQLVNVGITDITIVDKDIFKMENVYRHVLGFDNVNTRGSYKSEEMKKYLDRKYKDLKINAIAYDLIDCIDDKTLELECYDLIIVAIGNPNIEFYINSMIHSLGKKIPTIFTWNEPKGLGGHVLVTNNGNTGGCYECLYSDSLTGEKSLKNKAALIDNIDNYVKKYDGCGSAFIPYSYLDSLQTSVLCTRTALEVLTNKELGNPLRTWKGKKHDNIKTTKRYELTEIEMESSKYLYRNFNCKVCGDEENGN